MLGVGLSLTERRRSAFAPAALFSAGEVGAWYDPSDLTTLFQDAAGTTAVTTPGQVVGLMLDKSRGLTLGPELITAQADREFSSDTGFWLKNGAGVSITSGVARFNAAATNQSLQKDGFLTVGKTYQITVTVSNYSSGQLEIQAGGNNGSGFRVTSNGTFTATHVGLGTTLAFKSTLATALTCDIDNISVREILGNHAFQTGATSVRPIYAVEPATGRRNLLTFTEDLSNAVWLVTAASKTTAEKITAAATNNSHLIVQSVSLVSGQQYTYQQVLKYETCRFVSLRLFAGVFPHVCFDLVNGTLAASEAGASGAISNLGNGEYLCTITVTATASGTGNVGVFLQPSATNFGAAWTAVGTESVTIKKAQLETGSTATAYQRVVSQYDVTESGVASRHYLAFDGIDDWLQTGTITPGTDKVQVFAGVTKLANPAQANVVELSTNAPANNGSFYLSAPNNVGATAPYVFLVKGTAPLNFAASANLSAPLTDVLTGIGDIAGDLVQLRRNGALVGSDTDDNGTGNYLAYPLYIGRRAGTSLPFNGNLYGLIVRFGANLSTAQISNAERWMARRTGVTI